MLLNVSTCTFRYFVTFAIRKENLISFWSWLSNSAVSPFSTVTLKFDIKVAVESSFTAPLDYTLRSMMQLFILNKYRLYNGLDQSISSYVTGVWCHIITWKLYINNFECQLHNQSHRTSTQKICQNITVGSPFTTVENSTNLTAMVPVHSFWRMILITVVWIAKKTIKWSNWNSHERTLCAYSMGSMFTALIEFFGVIFRSDDYYESNSWCAAKVTHRIAK